MQLKRIFFTILLSGVLVSNSAFAAEGIKQSPVIDISGVMYMNYRAAPEYDSTSKEELNDLEGTFQVERTYVTLKSRLDDIFSVRVTADIAATERKDNSVYDSSGSKIGTVDDNRKQKYEFFVKYVYLQATKSLGAINMFARAGVVDTLCIGFINSLGDSRWIHKEFILNSKKILPSGSSIDNSADLGFNCQLDYSNLFSISFAYTNGEGFKQVDEGTNDGKAYYGRISITPIKGLYIYGFAKRQENNNNDDSLKITKADNDYSGFYGGGLAWKDTLIKIGFNVIMPYYYETDQATLDKTKVDNIEGEARKEYFIDSWINFSLEQLIDVPLLLYGRFAVGKDSNLEESTSVKRVTYFGTGIGYAFSKHVRFIAYYEEYRKDAETLSGSAYDPERAYYIKSEVKF
jgi:hypothetical protein